MQKINPIEMALEQGWKSTAIELVDAGQQARSVCELREWVRQGVL